MAQINRFEEIESWKKARELAKEVYLATGCGEFARDFGLRDQIRRATVSISSNIAEGFARRIGWACQCGVPLRDKTPDKRCTDCGRRYRTRDGRLELDSV